LLRLFFISIGLPLTCASSSSASTSSTAITLKSKSKTAPVLVDTTNTAPAVQLRDQGILEQSVREEGQVSEKDERTKRFEELINNKQYEEIDELGKDMNDEELLKCLCEMVTSLDHFKGLYEYLKKRKMVPDFLAHGGMVLVRKVIVESSLLETDEFGECNGIYDAIALSFEGGRHERVAGLFEAVQERPGLEDMFDMFMRGFFLRYPPEKNSMPLKRFLTLHGEEFNKKHPATFEIICRRLFWELKRQLDNPASQKLLIDLVGQPSLLTPVAFARGFFLCLAGDTIRANFIKYGYKEAIEEGLKEEYEFGRGMLWDFMVRMYPTQLSGAYPSTDEARAIALKDFKPTKQDLEEGWAKENAPILLKHLETLVTELPLYRDLLSIVAGYAITWVVV